MKIVMADADLTELDWIGLVGAFGLAWVLIWFVPPGLAIAVPIIGLSLRAGWRKRRSDREAAKAWLFDHGVAFGGAWAIAWTLVLFVPPALALLIAFSAMFIWMGWRKRQRVLLSGQHPHLALVRD